MNLVHPWIPAALGLSPLFSPLQTMIGRLNKQRFPILSEINTLLAIHQPEIIVQLGHRLKFVKQESERMSFEQQYEPRCFLSGEVQTRINNWHDLFNALVWLTFPKSKAAINARHFQALKTREAANETQRGRIRDMVTLFDESGVIVASANTELSNLLQSFQWKELFWQRREQVKKEMGFYIFGHGLYEKALQPYIGLTGQAMIFQVPIEFFNASLPSQILKLDQLLAEYLFDSENCLNSGELNPLPLLGVPGWSKENVESAYYDNTSYFRNGRRKSK